MVPVFPLDGDPLNDPLNDLDLFDDSLGFNMGPIDKEYSKSSSISGHGELPTSLGDISDADADKFNPTEFFSMINQTNFESPSILLSPRCSRAHTDPVLPRSQARGSALE